MFVALIYTLIALSRTFAATEDFSVATADQQRSIDYVSRDLRRAYTVTVSPDGKTLNMTVPDYYTTYDADGNPTGSPVTPTITDGVVNYNDPAKPLTVSYYLSGQSFIRKQTIGATGAVSTLVLASYAADFESNFSDATSIVNFSITFAPNFKVAAGRDAESRQGTLLTGTTSARNLRRD
jgi:hypothetical protein